MELQVRLKIGAPKHCAAKHFAQPFVAVAAVLAGGDQKRDVAVVRAGETIAHEKIGVGILEANPLIVANFTFDRIRPRHDLAAGMWG